MSHHIHISRPDGSFVANAGEFAGTRVRVMSGTRVLGGARVSVTNYDSLVPAFFDPAGKMKPLRPDALPTREDPKDTLKARPDVKEIQMEQFTMSKPTEANPFADLQIVIDDDDDIVAAEIIGEVEDAEEHLEGDELLESLFERDLKTAKLTAEEFNALKLNKKQLWHLNEQVIGRTVNKPTPSQAIKDILKSANSNGANYRRVIDAIKRVREGIK